MGKIIALANQKGGVGKTTTAINLSAYLAELGKRVLLVDIDPQGNAGSGLGLDVNSLEATTYEFFLQNIAAEKVIQKSRIALLDIIPANIELSGLEIDLREDEEKDYRLKKALAPLKDQYDFILIDCPPSLGLLTINALTASDSVLIPMQTEYFALEGLSQLLRIIKLVQSKMNKALALEGVVLTMYDSRTRLAGQVVQDVRSHFKNQVFEVIIPRNVRLSEAPSHGEPIGTYEPSSSGAVAYQRLAKELLDRNRN